MSSTLKCNDILRSIMMSIETNPCYLDSDNIVWKIIDGNFVGKRSVWTYDSRACWLEDTEIKNVKSWWCGKDSDYTEEFNK
jgi:hypothetical protein